MHAMRYREEWPLWSVEKRIYGEQVWVELDDVPDLTTKRDGITRMIEELSRLETMLHSAGITGWIAVVEHGNARMQKAFQIVQARPYAQDATYQYFSKLTRVPPIPASRMAVFRQAKERCVWN